VTPLRAQIQNALTDPTVAQELANLGPDGCVGRRDSSCCAAIQQLMRRDFERYDVVKVIRLEIE
jgi:hypothetical protein